MEKHHREGVESIIEEDLIHERCLIFGQGDDSYVVYKHQSPEGKVKKPFNPERDLNQIHDKKFHECLERIGTGVVGYDLKASDLGRAV